MSSSNVTLKQLIEFQPENNREKEIYNIHQYTLDDMSCKLQENMYYLGGQIRMQYNDEINLELFDKVREIDRKRVVDYGVPCNSWEAMSITNSKKHMEETEKIVKKYFEVMSLRESEIK